MSAAAYAIVCLGELAAIRVSTSSRCSTFDCSDSQTNIRRQTSIHLKVIRAEQNNDNLAHLSQRHVLTLGRTLRRTE